jgi:hypothetical protein
VRGLSDERMNLSFRIAADPRQRSHSQIRVPRGHDHILLSQIRDSPNLEGQVPVFISPRNMVTQLYPYALGSLLVASDSRGYGGGIRTCLHAVFPSPRHIASARTAQKTSLPILRVLALPEKQRVHRAVP